MPRKLRLEHLAVEIHSSPEALGQAAAHAAVTRLHETLDQRGTANLVLAAANSQLTFLQHLRQSPLPWDRLRIFHLDEYVGLPADHPASFVSFLCRHLLDHVRPLAFHPLATAAPAEETCYAYARLLRAHPIDLAIVGWGENGHLAFNDPPFADFSDPAWVKAVKLAEASRRQQVGEGHFPDLASVPTHALTLTIPAILAARQILCLVPETRKAQAVHDCLRLPISEERPGSILRQASHATLFLDEDSAALL